jgi:cation transport regulator ChaC
MDVRSEWIFAYGSLIWRPDFEWRERHRAEVKGWARRFWQGSADHRGVPGAPGRVVTLVEQAEASCVGRVFRVAEDQMEAILAQLDIREQGGYERVGVSVGLGTGRRVEAVTYVAPPGNPHWLGPGPWEATVQQIRSARGPSGSKVDCVLALADALHRLVFVDDHVRGLARALRKPRNASPA